MSLLLMAPSTARNRIGRWLWTAMVGAVTFAMSGCGAQRKEPWEKAPLPPGGVEVVRLRDGPPLAIDRVRFFSKELGEARFFLVLRPSGVAELGHAWILNHGWADRPEYLLSELGVDATYARLLGEGRVRPAAVVLPDVRFPASFRRSAEESRFPVYLTLVAEEIAGLVADRYKVPVARERWGIGGFSFGGYMSLDVARRYTGRFGSASVISAFYDSDWTFWPKEPPPAGPLNRRGRGKQTTIVEGPTPRLMLACGTSDRFIGQMRTLHDMFTRMGIAHEWSETAGGHTWEYWRSVLEPMFLFHLSADPARGSGQSGAPAAALRAGSTRTLGGARRP